MNQILTLRRCALFLAIFAVSVLASTMTAKAAFANVAANAAAVPERASMILLGISLVGLAAGLRRRRKK